MLGSSGLPHIIQKVLMFVSNQTLPSQSFCRFPGRSFTAQCRRPTASPPCLLFASCLCFLSIRTMLPHHIGLKSRFACAAPQYPVHGMRLFPAEYINEIKLTLDVDHNLSFHVLPRLFVRHPERNVFDLRLSWIKPRAISGKTSYGSVSERKVDIATWNHKREAGRILNVKIHRHLLNEALSIRQGGRFTAPALYVDPLGHGYLLHRNLPFNRLKSPNGGGYTPRANYHQSKGEQSNRCSAPDPKLVIEILLWCLLLCGPGLGMWAIRNLDDKRRILSSTLGWLGIGIFGLGWFGWWAGLFFGLPYGWPPCYPLGNGNNSDQNKSSHMVSVSKDDPPF